MEKTQELFNSWNVEKQHTEHSNTKKIVKSGEIWICKIGVNIGSEVSKDATFTRPALVIHTDIGGDLVFVVPITSKVNTKFKHLYQEIIDYKIHGLNLPSFVMLNQARPMSIKRLKRKLNNITIEGTLVPLYLESNLSTIKVGIAKVLLGIKKELLFERGGC